MMFWPRMANSVLSPVFEAAGRQKGRLSDAEMASVRQCRARRRAMANSPSARFAREERDVRPERSRILLFRATCYVDT